MAKKLTYEELEQRVKELDKEAVEHRRMENSFREFCEIGKALSMERKIDKLLPVIMTGLSKVLEADRSTLFLVPWDQLTLWTRFAEGLDGESISLDLKMGLAGVCALTKEIVNIANAYEDPRFNRETDSVTGFRTESVLCAPLVNKLEGVIGVLELLNSKTGVFSREDEEKAFKSAALLADIDFSDDAQKGRANALVDDIRQATECQRGCVFLLNKEKGELRSVIGQGLGDREIRLSLSLGIAGLVAVTGEELNIQDAYADSRFDKSTDERTGYRTRDLLCVPIKNQSGDIIGVIEAINKKNGTFTGRDLDLLKGLSSQVAMFIENAILANDYHVQFMSILEVLAASIDAKDPLTANHSQKVNEYATGIARELGFREADIEILSVSALLHDYGKLGTNENILKKPGKLSPQEYEHIKQHAKNTRDILSRMYLIRQYRNVPLIASSHHERLDGSGYFQGLRDHEIHFMAKIIAVADVFDALTAKRHYRDALSSEAAFEILEQGIGTQFDENIVEALKKYWEKQRSQQIASTG